MANPARKLTTGPHAFNHFWPRLWLTARALGYEARQWQKKGELPDCLSPLDNIDTRIFVRGGEWLSAHQDLIVPCNLGNMGTQNAGTNEAGTKKSDVGSRAISIYTGDSEGTSLGGQEHLLCSSMGTCVLFSEGSPLYEASDIGRRPSCLQGVVMRVDSETGTVELKMAKSSGNSCVIIKRMTLELANKDIWWCFPFWVAARYLVHGGKVPVEAGFYFLAEPGQEFQAVTVNWADQEFLTENSVDGTTTSSDRWHLAARATDKSPVVACLYETTASSTSVEGARFEFKERPKVKEACRNWEEELRTETGVVCETIFTIKQAEIDLSDLSSHEESSDEDKDSDPDFEEELNQKARRAHGRKKAAKRKRATNGRSGPAKRKERTADQRNHQKEDTAGASKKGRYGETTPVKQDSKWALHRSLAPARGALKSDSFSTIQLEPGDKLGEKHAHYREASWFGNVDLLLQEEGLKAARGLAIVSPNVPGQSQAEPIEFPDSDTDDVSHPPARTAAHAHSLQSPKAEPASHVSTPSRSGKALAAGPAGDVNTTSRRTAAPVVADHGDFVNTPSAGAKAPRTEPGAHVSTPGGRPKLLKVKYHETGKLGSPSYVVQVPRSESIFELKTQARQALAEPDVAGESVLTARLRWTFLDEDGSEVDISKHTTADNLDRSPAINVYVRA